MRVLLDENLSPRTTRFLRSLGVDALDLRELQSLGVPDGTVYSLAKGERAILLTFDGDFANTFLSHGDLPGLILLRVHPQTFDVLHPVLEDFFARVPQEMLAGAMTVVERGRYRIRRP